MISRENSRIHQRNSSGSWNIDQYTHIEVPFVRYLIACSRTVVRIGCRRSVGFKLSGNDDADRSDRASTPSSRYKPKDSRETITNTSFQTKCPPKQHQHRQCHQVGPLNSQEKSQSDRPFPAPMRPNNAAADLKPQGEASAKVKVGCTHQPAQTCSTTLYTRGVVPLTHSLLPALLRMQRREGRSRRMHALLQRRRSTGRM